MSNPDSARGLGAIVRPLLAGGIVLLSLMVFGTESKWSFKLGLGSSGAPARQYGYYLAFYALFGLVAAYLFGLGVARLLSPEHRRYRVLAYWNAIADHAWISVLTLIGIAIPLVIRNEVLGGAFLSDQESAHRFMAELFASGRAWAESHPLPEAFDRRFMINDGRMYSELPFGWALLMAPGVRLGIGPSMASIYFGLGVPAVFFVIRRLGGSAWAKVGTVLYVLSPMIAIAAATELPHTASLVALVWLTWAVLRAADDRVPWWIDASVVALFGVALLVRPTAALAMGIPLVVAWLVAVLRRGRQAMVGLAAGLGAAALILFVFTSVNAAQTGAGWRPAAIHALELGGELESASTRELWLGLIDHTFTGAKTATMAANLGIALYRLSPAVLGWACSFVFMPFALRDHGARLMWISFVGMLGVHLYTGPLGMDAFGPTNFIEIAWPTLVLTVLGMRALTRFLARLEGPERPDVHMARPASFPLAFALGLQVVSFPAYAHVRLEALEDMADTSSRPADEIVEAGLENALVFGPRRYLPKRCQKKVKSFLTDRPNNDPDLVADVLWVRTKGTRPDQALMAYFPDRIGYRFRWQRDCTVRFVPLRGRRAVAEAEDERIEKELDAKVEEPEEEDEGEKMRGRVEDDG